MSRTELSPRLRRYLPNAFMDADDIRQELIVAELEGVDPAGHVWNMLRRVVRRQTPVTDEPPPAPPSDDGVTGPDIIDRLPLPPKVRRELKDAYPTGGYTARQRLLLRHAGRQLKKEDHL